MELEFHQLAMKYQALRVAKPAFRARLMASLASEGQLQPVLVVRNESESDGYVLIDGYHRASALTALGRDSVEAMVLPFCEAGALIFRHCQQNAYKRSALEDGWLLRELMDVAGMSQAELSRRFQKSESWVSRRVSLVRELPEAVQQQVRRGELCSHAAAKYLVPLARAKRADCEKLAANLAGARISARQMQRVYTAYKSANAEQRRRVVAGPLLFLKSAEQLRSEPEKRGSDDMQAVLDDMQILDAVSGRARRRLGKTMAGIVLPDTVIETWLAAQSSFVALSGAMEKRIDAGQRNQNSDSAPHG